jgi:hypothetical protein
MSTGWRIIALFVFIVPLVAGCQQKIPKEALSFTPQTLEHRAIQTRTFETTDEAKILAASMAVLQDLGFSLDESETRLGLIVGSKKRNAKDIGQIVGTFLLAAFTGVAVPYDVEQTIRCSLVSCPHGLNSDRVAVRVTFQRIVVDSSNTERRSTVNDAEIYQQFFEKLSQSVFLEAHEL